MNKFLLTAVLILTAAFSIKAQSPQSFQYQAVARDITGLLLQNQTVSFQISIREANPTGTIIYQEVHPASTNDFGLANLEIGTGLVGVGDFTSINWSANTHYLEVEFDPAGGFAFQAMGTTQLLSVPYALHANTASIVDDADADPLNEIQNLSILGSDLSISGGNSVTLPSGSGGTLDESYDSGGPGAGRIISADAGAVEIESPSPSGVALDAKTTGIDGVSVRGENTNASSAFSVVQAVTNGNSNLASAVIGNSDGGAWGVTGQVTSGATAEAAVYGSNFRTNGGHGVRGIGFNGTIGETNYSQGFGVYGFNADAIAPLGNGIGVAGTGYWGVIGEDLYLGAVFGAYGVLANGELGATGFKSFVIDHPADPENKVLRHFSIESDEVLNVYRGSVLADANGDAIVEMPSYYDLVSANPSIHLTAVGLPADLYVKSELVNGQFEIGGAESGMKINWVVYAERNDPYAQQNPHQKQVEAEKTERNKGKYYMPYLYGKGIENKLVQTPKTSPQRKLSIR